jgi:hypothetical protein
LHTSLRSSRANLAGYSDGLKNCGESTLKAMRENFFAIIQKLVITVKHFRGPNHYIIKLLNGLAWDYQLDDLQYLVDLNLFEVITKGDGSKIHPLFNAKFAPGVLTNINPYLDANIQDESILLGHRVELLKNLLISSVLNCISTS